MRDFAFDVRMEDGFKATPMVVGYPEVAAGRYLIIRRRGTPIRVTDLRKIAIEFDYPIRKPAVMEFESENGFMLLDLYRCIYDGYRKIYASEEDPETNGILLNRASSSGPYEIWGHYIDDLFLEGITEIAPGHFSLQIGS